MKSFERWMVAVLCGAIGYFYVWTVRSSGEEWSFGDEKRDYYNLLIDGYLDGQLHMNVEVPDALLKVSDPYDPKQRPAGLGMHDASFYQGRYYVYFGAAPMMVLMLPFRVFTGSDLPLSVAVLVFVYVGFLVSVSLFLRIRRRYFPETGTVTALFGVIVLGLAGLCAVLLRRPDMWELPIAGGYCFAMLALATIWRSLHSERARARWFAAAGLCLGLAIASRPTYLFAVPALVPPLLWWWRIERQLPWRTAFSAAAPLALVGALMAAHNYARFDHPLEFGQAYQLSLDYESKLPHFGARYVPFTAKAHFVSAARWSPYFPFIQRPDLGPAPVGFTIHRGDVYGLLTNFPIAWFAFLTPLAFWRRSQAESGPLVAWMTSAVLLFGLVTGFLLFFFSALARYQMDFVPTLMLLACLGVLALERWALRLDARDDKGSATNGEHNTRSFGKLFWRGLARLGWIPAATFSALFGVIFSLGYDGLLRENNPDLELRVARRLNRISAVFERVFGVKYGPVELTLRLPRVFSGRETLLTLGEGANLERVFVQYNADGRVQFGVLSAGRAEQVSRPLALAPQSAHRIEVTLGAFYPPATHPVFAGKSMAEVVRVRRLVCVKVNGDPVLMNEQRTRTLDARKLAVGSEAGLDPAYRDFSGEVVATRRVAHLPATGSNSGSFLRMRLRFAQVEPGACEPLVSYGAVGSGFLLSATRVSAEELKFNLGGAVSGASDTIRFQPDRVHEVVARIERDPASQSGMIHVWFDGAFVWGRELALGAFDYTAVVVAKNVTSASDCATEFRGEVLSVQEGSKGRALLEGKGDTLRLRLRWPVKRSVRPEPIVVTGCTGQADILMVEHVDDQSIRFALDHWGSPLRTSAPIRVDASQTHELEIMMTSLASVDDANATSGFRSGALRVSLNGTVVWQETGEFFFTEPGEVSLGRNNVGGTTCALEFSGDILEVERRPRE